MNALVFIKDKNKKLVELELEPVILEIKHERISSTHVEYRDK